MSRSLPPVALPTVDCGCAPSAEELRHLDDARVRHTLGRRGFVRIGALGLLAAASLGVAAPAFAAAYPTWDDVQRARANEAAKATEISHSRVHRNTKRQRHTDAGSSRGSVSRILPRGGGVLCCGRAGG